MHLGIWYETMWLRTPMKDLSCLSDFGSCSARVASIFECLRYRTRRLYEKFFEKNVNPILKLKYCR